MSEEPKPATEKVRKVTLRPHYVNNRELSDACASYVVDCDKREAAGLEAEQIPEYIGESIKRISEGLSRKPNFATYSYRDEMVMDGILDSIKAVRNFNAKTETRIGRPNAFGYFTQIAFWAFLRRIAREKKQESIKATFRNSASIGAFAHFGEEGDVHGIGEGMIERIRHRNEVFFGKEDMSFPPELEPAKKKSRNPYFGQRSKAPKPTSTAPAKKAGKGKASIENFIK